MPPQETRPEAGEPDETFIDDLIHIFLKPHGGKNPALDDRQRLLDILSLNTQYLKRSGADAKTRQTRQDHKAYEKLAVISLALWDLEHGVSHPMFKAKKLEHGAPDSTDIWRSRTTLAIAFDYLMAAGIPSQDASKKIEDATEDADDQAFTPMSALFSPGRRGARNATLSQAAPWRGPECSRTAADEKRRGECTRASANSLASSSRSNESPGTGRVTGF